MADHPFVEVGKRLWKSVATVVRQFTGDMEQARKDRRARRAADCKIRGAAPQASVAVSSGTVGTGNIWFRARSHRIGVAGTMDRNEDGTSRQAILMALRKNEDAELVLVRDPGNPNGATELAVMSPFGQIGFVPSELSQRWSPQIDAGSARYTVGHCKVDEPKEGRGILSLQLDVHEWRRDVEGRRFTGQPPPHARLNRR